jgi:NitT/TauT family transport system substrate-binding protein
MLESGRSIRRRTLLQLTALSASVWGAPVVRAQPRLEKARIGIAVPGKGELHYLPLTIAEQLGYSRPRAWRWN